jgi:hypothetical protein
MTDRSLLIAADENLFMTAIAFLPGKSTVFSRTYTPLAFHTRTNGSLEGVKNLYICILLIISPLPRVTSHTIIYDSFLFLKKSSYLATQTRTLTVLRRTQHFQTYLSFIFFELSQINTVSDTP